MNIEPIVEVEEEIYSFEPADNGAGPLWCHGSTILARQGDEVYAALLETLPDQKPLNNCRWLLYRRTPEGWRLVHRDRTGRTREPSPVALLGCGDLLVSANPTLTGPEEQRGPAQPAVFRFDTRDLASPPRKELPVWKDSPAFTEHSYRTLAADRENNEVLYMQNVGYDVAHLSFLDRNGKWQGLGTLSWPWGGEYDPPRPLRLCYPNVFLKDREVHFFGVGDIVEPVARWKQAKFEITGRQWDYVFRRLFYAYTPDVTCEPFGAWIEIADRDATAGAMRNGDVWVDAEGTVHLIWCETSVDERLRDRFFPDEPIVHSLEYLTFRKGWTAAPSDPVRPVRRTLARVTEDEEGLRPTLARFHVLEDGRLLALASFVRNRPDSASPAPVYRIALLPPRGDAPDWVEVSLLHPPPGTFLTNTVRGGSAPSPLVDLVGMSPEKAHTLAYARIRVKSDS